MTLLATQLSLECCPALPSGAVPPGLHVHHRHAQLMLSIMCLPLKGCHGVLQGHNLPCLCSYSMLKIAAPWGCFRLSSVQHPPTLCLTAVTAHHLSGSLPAINEQPGHAAGRVITALHCAYGNYLASRLSDCRCCSPSVWQHACRQQAAMRCCRAQRPQVSIPPAGAIKGAWQVCRGRGPSCRAEPAGAEGHRCQGEAGGCLAAAAAGQADRSGCRREGRG